MPITHLPLLAGAAPPILSEMVALLVVSIVSAYLCLRLKLVPIAGFLLAGVLIGPNALGLVRDVALVEDLAEIGVILLLFAIGVEFSLEKLARLGRAILIGGGIQTLGTLGIVAVALVLLGVPWSYALFTGGLVALSSTAIVLTLLQQRKETDTPFGKLSLSVLLFQDFAVIVFVMVLPLIANQGGSVGEGLLTLLRAVLVIVSVILAARFVVPRILERVASTQNSDLFLLTIVAIVGVTAWLVALAEVSMALGAFVAGIVVSESRFSEKALSDILPLKTVFNAVFFVSVGMLLDPRYAFDHAGLVLGIVAGVMVLKILITGGAVLALGYPIRSAAAVGLGLAQIGEFSFVLDRAGASLGLSPAGLGAEGSQAFIAVSVVLMLLTPFMVSVGPRFGMWMQGRFRAKTSPELQPDELQSHTREDHVIVVGFGPAGKRLSDVLTESGIPFVVIDMNPVAERKATGVPFLLGDATREHILDHAGVKEAKLLVIAINDREATRAIVARARVMNPTLQIIVRTRFLSEIEILHRAGADVVVPEELETTVRLFSHVLGAYMVPPERIEEHVRTLRSGDYQILRGSIQEAHLMVLQGLDEEGLHTRAVLVRPGAPIVGKTLAEANLRQQYGITVLAIRRGTRTIGSPDGLFVLEAGDRLVLIGLAKNFAACADQFRAPVSEMP